MAKIRLYISGIKLKKWEDDNGLTVIGPPEAYGRDLTNDLNIIARDKDKRDKYRFHDFLFDVCSKVAEMNTAGVGVDNGLFCRMFPFWCIIHRDPKTGLLLSSISSFETFAADQSYIPDGFLDETLRTGEPSDITKIYHYRQLYPLDEKTKKYRTPLYTFNYFTSSEKTKGYTVIDIELSRPSYILAGELNTCKWCGSELPIEHRCGKPRKYCSDDCKKNYGRFNRSFLKLLDAWKEYTEYIKSGNLDKANELKNKSVYGHLFDEKLNYAEQWFNTEGCGIMISMYIRQPCQNCGGEISVFKDIRARFCSDKCRDEYNNKRKKEN